MLPAQQYASYVDLLTDLGMRAVTFSDGASVTKQCRLNESSDALLECAEAEAAALGLPPTLPLVLLGHSRGAKLSVLAAAKATRPVAAMVLLDPVDATPFEPASTMGTLARLSVPTAVIGAADSAADCAPTGGNYATFFDTLATSAAPRLLALLQQAGHLQFVDKREALLASGMCTAGPDDDTSVHEVAMAVISAWLASFVPGVGSPDRRAVASTLGTGRTSGGYLQLAEQICGEATACVDTLQRIRFRSQIDWKSGGLPLPAANPPPPRRGQQGKATRA